MTRLALGSVALVALFVSAPVVSARQEASPVQAPPARQVLDAALTKAKAEHKNVFVHFSASWCGWCHKLEAFMKTDEGQLLQQYAVDVQLVVLESKGKELLEHPGGQDLLKAWGGDRGGIPFYVFLDDTGTVLVNSNNMPNGGNIGYPANAVEVKAFEGVLVKGVPKLPAATRNRILAWITGHP
jgi:thiol:disulfide interchange protein